MFRWLRAKSEPSDRLPQQEPFDDVTRDVANIVGARGWFVADGESVDQPEDYVRLTTQLLHLGHSPLANHVDEVVCVERRDGRQLTLKLGDGQRIDTKLDDSGWIDDGPLIHALNEALVAVGDTSLHYYGFYADGWGQECGFLIASDDVASQLLALKVYLEHADLQLSAPAVICGAVFAAGTIQLGEMEVKGRLAGIQIVLGASIEGEATIRWNVSSEPIAVEGVLAAPLDDAALPLPLPVGTRISSLQEGLAAAQFTSEVQWGGATIPAGTRLELIDDMLVFSEPLVTDRQHIPANTFVLLRNGVWELQ